MSQPLTLDKTTLSWLFRVQGPSLGLWRAAEIAVLRQCEFPRPILDLGCGDGLVSSMVLKRVDAGIDPDPEALTKASRVGVYLKLENAFVEYSRLPENHFGAIISNSVLEHIPDLDPVLVKARNLLRPGGRFVFTVPTERFSHCLALPFTRYSAWRNRQLCHLNLWSESRWREALREAGFEVLTIRPYLRNGLVFSWDVLELMQQARVARRRLFGLAWRRLPHCFINYLARRASQLDLSSPAPGGGRLIVVERPSL